MTGTGAFRLTQYARGGGCACKIPPGELEETIARLVPGGPGADLMVGVEHGEDGPWCGSARRWRCGDRRLLHPGWGTTPTPSGGSPPLTPCRTSTRWAASR